MPQLSSGRQFALGMLDFESSFAELSDRQKYFWIMTYRMQIKEPIDLADILPIVYFEGEPPDAPRYESGFTVGDVKDGKSDWSDAEIEELQHWLTTSRADRWLRDAYEKVNQMIKHSTVWESDWLNGNSEQ